MPRRERNFRLRWQSEGTRDKRRRKDDLFFQDTKYRQALSALGTYGGPGTSRGEPARITESAINTTGHLDTVTLRGSAPENSGCVVSDFPR